MNMGKPELTKRQKQIFGFISDRIRKAGSPPTIREIGNQFAISSTNGVRSILSALITKGYIRKHPGLSRGLELVDDQISAYRTVPAVGTVPAGLPLLAEENSEGFYAVDESFLPVGDVFMLRVTGESMIEEGIFDGDFVLVKKQETAESGEIVVAVIGGEATVKKYRPNAEAIVLEPANPAFAPIEVDAASGDFYLAGKVVGLMRRM
jgi:repressor LexA